MESPSGLCCEVGSLLAETLVLLESRLCSSVPGHRYTYLAPLRFVLWGQQSRFSKTEALSTARGHRDKATPHLAPSTPNVKMGFLNMCLMHSKHIINVAK